jgi:hypothetical protein
VPKAEVNVMRKRPFAVTSRRGSDLIGSLDQTGRDEGTMGILARFAVAQRSTAECLGLFAAAQRQFERRGVDFQLVAFETAAERGIEGLIAGQWDYIEIGVVPLVRLRRRAVMGACV